MPNNHKSLALQALEQMKGKKEANKILLGHASETQLANFPGYRSLTKQQLLAEYEQHEARIQAAMEWVRRQEDRDYEL